MDSHSAGHKIKIDNNCHQVGTLSAKEFVDYGYLQELNRTFLAPLGLIMEIIPPLEGNSLGELKIHDFRQVPELALLSTSEISQILADNVGIALDVAAGKRLKKLGFVFQPVPGDDTEANAT